MTIAYRELQQGARPGGIDYHQKRVATRTFRVDTPDVVLARATVDAHEGGVNAQYPGDPGLIVDSVGWSVFEDVCTDIVYNYSSDRRASLPPRINKDNPYYYSFRESTTSTDVKYPYAKRVLTTMPQNAGDPPQHRYLWTIFDDRSIAEVRTTLAVNVTVANWSLEYRGIVQAQTNKIHSISGVDYLFKGADISQRTDSSGGVKLYDATYSWLGDPGTAGVAIGSYDSSQLLFPAFNRPPFYEYVVIPSPTLPPDDPAAWPLFRVVTKYDRDNLGWTTLPGIPPL